MLLRHNQYQREMKISDQKIEWIIVAERAARAQTDHTQPHEDICLVGNRPGTGKSAGLATRIAVRRATPPAR
jgi:hypothetical protein